MTRRDFIMLSDALREAKGRIMDDATIDGSRKINQLRGVRRSAAMISAKIADDNPTFDIQRFLTDCGYGGTG
jgi:hypothetical protein